MLRNACFSRAGTSKTEFINQSPQITRFHVAGATLPTSS
jgi:hypothetical protein